MGSGGAEGRRATTPDAKISGKKLADEDARRQAKNARACDQLLADLIRFHGRGRNHAGRPRNLDRPLPMKARHNG
jgi:hypothetical protein